MNKHPRTTNTIEELEAVGDYVAISNGGIGNGDTYRTVNVVKTDTGFAVIDNGEETEAATAEEAAAIAADYVQVHLG